ncbi:MAG: type II toxin-antitoxin system RelE/ParE family toxin [Alphaproteobacteria bacterium]|nr:type II toxin-antitoxin system RelE/ParE family toxin [Alphaproteobacteria bacterium]
MFTILQTQVFTKWLENLNDKKAVLIIAERLERVRYENFGNVRSVGEGVSELKINYGPGYRVYFYQKDKIIVVVLCGGDKSSQQKDIEKAKELKRCLQKRN